MFKRIRSGQFLLGVGSTPAPEWVVLALGMCGWVLAFGGVVLGVWSWVAIEYPLVVVEHFDVTAPAWLAVAISLGELATYPWSLSKPTDRMGRSEWVTVGLLTATAATSLELPGLVTSTLVTVIVGVEMVRVFKEHVGAGLRGPRGRALALFLMAALVLAFEAIRHATDDRSTAWSQAAFVVAVLAAIASILVFMSEAEDRRGQV